MSRICWKGENRNFSWKLFFIVLIYINFWLNGISACDRRPQGASGDKSAVDDSFRITIEGNPATYIPGQPYNVTLSCDIAFKFISFTLVTEAELETIFGGYDMTGHFEIIDSTETRFSTQCENMVESSNMNIKHRIDIAWVAPTNPNSTCVYLKAAVLQHRNVWFMDDGFLTKQICPEEIDDVNSQTPLVNPCCACDEAKYELVLERRWTRNTHSKDYPKEDWRTRFSELIGASHDHQYRFWAYGSRASPGLEELAEHGSTTTLESEIKEQTESGSIRTIIKAPGVPFRKNVMSSTLATVRVDPRHHMISFVTKIVPSPDWILGIAGMELCLANCTWIERKVLNLFPWDVGTDSGPSYMSPDQQQIPADVVRRISSTHPSDYRSPFYDESGAPMKPMATLSIIRKKLYERECETDDNVALECATHPWVDWTECSTKCGPGTQYRTRGYKDVGLARRFNCEVVLRQSQRCVGTQCGLQEENENTGEQLAECELSNWSNWSPCSQNCGRGTIHRTRNYKKPYARENCQAGAPMELEQTKSCLGTNCGGDIPNSYDNGGFRVYNNEPHLMMENNNGNRNSGYKRQNKYRRPNQNERPNEQWNAETRNPNRFGVDEIRSEDNYDMNNMRNEQQNLNYNNENQNYPNSNLEDNNYADISNNGGNNFNYADTNNERNEDFNNEQWINENLPNNQMDNNFSAREDDDGNENIYGNENNEMQGPTVYNQQRPQAAYQQRTTERTGTSRFRSPGFYPPKNELVDADTIVQEYCFEKPYVVKKSCAGKRVISNYWFFDPDDQDCKLFTTDNCDENKNKFRSLEACEGTCLQPQLNLRNQQEFQQESSNENDWQNRFGAPQSQLRPTKSSGRRNQYEQGNESNRKYRKNNRQQEYTRF